MLRDEVPLHFPCGASFAEMKKLEDRKRLCAACDTVVHDLSAMSEDEARALLASRDRARLCVRYLYDARTGEIAFEGLVPAASLTARMKQRFAQAALLAAPLVLVEACGGNDGRGYPTVEVDAGSATRTPDDSRIIAQPGVADGSADANGDAGSDASTDAPADAGTD